MTNPASPPASSGSVSFDRAAGYYDRTRSSPEPTQRRVTAVLAAELRPRGRVLEIGVGTGRIALPLHAEGIPMAGLDLSRAMLDRLVAKAGGTPPFPLAQGDATAIPFATASFGAALAPHVLHLIPDWRAAVGELVRVIRPGGAILVDAGTGGGRGWSQRINGRFRRETGLGQRFVGAQDNDEVEAGLREMGFEPRLLPTVRGSAESAPSALLDSLEAGEYSWTWPLSPEVRRRAAAATRRWAAEWLGDLDRPRASRWTVGWRAFDLPG